MTEIKAFADSPDGDGVRCRFLGFRTIQLPLFVQMRSADCLEKCLLSGVTWKTLLALSSSQFDPMYGPAVRCKVDVAELAVSGLVTFTHRRAPMVPTLSRGCICW